MSNAIERIRRGRVVAVLRRAANVDRIADQLVAGGIDLIEVTMDDPGATAEIERLRARGDVLPLAGTVRSAAQVDLAVDAGAQACVAPTTVPETIDRCLDRGVPCIPGALTPTEIEAAHARGAAIVKLFPASLGGPRYLREVLAPLPEVPIMVSGGVGVGEVATYLDAGAVAVAVGSPILAAEDVSGLARELRRAADGQGP